MDGSNVPQEDGRGEAMAHAITRRDSLAVVAAGLALPALSTRAIAQAAPATPPPAAAATTSERKVHILRANGRYLRNSGTSGELSAGFWRTHANAMYGDVRLCKPDGSCPVGTGYRTPSNESSVIVEGAGLITVKETGTKRRIETGLIVSHPKNIENTWDIEAPYLKKFFVSWNSTNGPEGGDLVFGDASDNPAAWQHSRWLEPVGGEQRYGEAYFVRRDTSPHTMLTGIWRAGVGIAGGQAPTSPVVCSAVHGDISLFILEGRFRIRNEETKDEYEVKAGEGVGLCEGLRTTWTPLTPFVKTYFVVTKDAPFVPSASARRERPNRDRR